MQHQAVQITDHVYWVGAIDREIRDFHGYATPRGTTYNAYLIAGESLTLVDTVKAPFREELLARIASVADPRKIRVIVSNHSELDHSGCLPELIALAKPERVYASAMGVKALAEHRLAAAGVTAVKDGETIDLGGLHLTFTETRMLHWPDSMFSYLAEDRLLFSQDAFGMHLASDERYTDELPPQIVHREAARYYANILLPYSSRIRKLIAKLADTELPSSIIAPDHGPIWRTGQDWILNAYSRWAAPPVSRKAVIVFDTMWQSTERMAEALADGLRAGGGEAVLMPLRDSHRSDVITEVLEAGALLVGSPTLNDQLFPTVADVMTYLKGLKPQGLVGAIFGSYGWTATAVEELKRLYGEMGIELVDEPLKIKYVPDEAALEQCRALGRRVAERLAERHLVPA